MSEDLLAEITVDTNRTFLQRHFDLSFELMAALGSVKPFDDRIADIMDGYESRQEWKISRDDIPDLRATLRKVEARVRLWKFWQ